MPHSFFWRGEGGRTRDLCHLRFSAGGAFHWGNVSCLILCVRMERGHMERGSVDMFYLIYLFSAFSLVLDYQFPDVMNL